ncbi:unnamed protein product [Adineta steineri]|uniref:Uncharacterized protein n=1 Tax=Adineta steineri TaxID=433720 RepID=A0A815IK28_9BILA|nr:unnamed protein product [Adineta steineri]
MSSVVFRPLLHDPLGWKQSCTSYTDHYKWRKYGSKNKSKLTSTYGQRFQRQLRKQKQANQRSSPVPTNEEQAINRIIVVKKCETEQQQPKTSRYLPTTTPVFIVENEKRPATAYVDSNCCTQVLQRPPTAPAAIQEQTSSTPEVKNSPPVKEEKEKEKEKGKRPVDADNDNSRHWLTFLNPKTPQKIIDIKQRLGQLNVPTTLARPSTTSNIVEQTQQTTQPITRSASASIQKQQTNDNQHNFLTFEKRETPDDLRAARYRLDKYRYHPTLDNYPLRPQTCPDRTNDSPKPITPPELKNKPYTPQQQQPKSDIWTAQEERKPRTPNNESVSNYIQIVNCDNLPNEYANALEISNAAQNAYEKNLRMNGGRRPDSLVYRLPAKLPDNKNVLFATYQNQQQSTEMNNPLRQVVQGDNLGVWIRNATNKERASAMKIVQDVLNPSMLGYDKQPTTRSLSVPRKLGYTRTQHKFPCEICEKLLIKRHVWDLSGSEGLTCPHHPQGNQVRV